MLSTFLSILLIQWTLSQSCFQPNYPLYHSNLTTEILNQTNSPMNYLIDSFVNQINMLKLSANESSGTIPLQTSEEHILKLQELSSSIKHTLFHKEQEKIII